MDAKHCEGHAQSLSFQAPNVPPTGGFFTSILFGVKMFNSVRQFGFVKVAMVSGYGNYYAAPSAIKVTHKGVGHKPRRSIDLVEAFEHIKGAYFDEPKAGKLSRKAKPRHTISASLLP